MHNLIEKRKLLSLFTNKTMAFPKNYETVATSFWSEKGKDKKNSFCEDNYVFHET